MLKLRRNRRVMALAFVLSIVVCCSFFGYTAIEHGSNPSTNGPAGGPDGFERARAGARMIFGALTAALIGTEAGTADQSSGVFRDLVATGARGSAVLRASARGDRSSRWLFNGAGLPARLIATFVFAGSFPTPGVSMILQAAAWIVASNVMLVGLAVGVGSLTGSRAVTLTAVIGWQAVATQLLSASPRSARREMGC